MNENEILILDFFRPSGIPYAVLILLATITLGHFTTSSLGRLGQRFADRRLLIQQVSSFARFMIYLVGCTGAIAAILNLRREVLIALAGTAAVSVGFALKDFLASIVAGVIILVDRPFQVGDRVSFDGYYGEIRHIGLRSVRLVTLDDTQITIPNNKFLTDSVASGNAGDVQMMIQMDFYIGLDQDVIRAKQIVAEALTTSRYIALDRLWKVLVSSVVEQSYIAIRLRAKAYVIDVRFETDFESDVCERVFSAFHECGVAPPARYNERRSDATRARINPGMTSDGGMDAGD
jgi:small-conductance mechanosensitive channel